jgi:uncharacterized Zn-binding protein involved in type VI secretion
MRRTLSLIGAALAAAVAVAVAAPSTGAGISPPSTDTAWFNVATYVTINGSDVAFTGHAFNVGSITHTGAVEMTLVKELSTFPFSRTIFSQTRSVTLKPMQHWFSGAALIRLAPGHYTATTTAAHVFELNDPSGLAGAKTASTMKFTIP